MDIRIRRVYDPPADDEGACVLVDRLWPRGVARARLAGVEWIKEIAPSEALRKSFAHRPERWSEFRRRYFAELDANPEAVAKLRRLARGGRLTLLYAARDPERNNAVALREYLQR